jgi:hypothetical protein
MARRSVLVAVSTVQLAANLLGQAVALRRRRPFDVPFMHGDPAHVGRDSWWFGTAYSAPSYILAAQAYAIARLASGPDGRARGMLRLIGTSVVPGYLSERYARRLLTPAGFDPVETPIVVVGLAGALAMAVLGAPRQPRP